MRVATSLVVLLVFVPVAVRAQPVDGEAPPVLVFPPPVLAALPPPQRSVPLMATGGVMIGLGAVLVAAGLGVIGDGIRSGCGFSRCNDEASGPFIGVIVLGVAALHLAIGGVMLGVGAKKRPPSQRQLDLALERGLRLTEPEVAARLRKARRMIVGGAVSLSLSALVLCAGAGILNGGVYYTAIGPENDRFKQSLIQGGAATIGIGIAAMTASAVVLGIGVRRTKELRSSYEQTYGHGGTEGTFSVAPWGASNSGGLSMAGTF